MVFAVDCKIKIDNSGLKEVLKACKYLENNVAHAGVINADPKTVEIAAKNEFGGHSVYTYGPYAGEPVEVPQRSFIMKSINQKDDKIIEWGAMAFQNEFSERSAREAVDRVGDMAAETQRVAIDTNGEGVPDWQTWQDYRTIITKGHDKPLHTRNMETFPIDYEITKRSA